MTARIIARYTNEYFPSNKDNKKKTERKKCNLAILYFLTGLFRAGNLKKSSISFHFLTFITKFSTLLLPSSKYATSLSMRTAEMHETNEKS